ncbi:MAG: dephospho-CoA kinase [Clostridia bacterium]|nr:dephospho-CoA kinase [Clostridia bacterium]
MPVNNVYVVGITGGIGCGKSMAAAYLAELGAIHIDADGISRALTARDGAALEQIRRIFGDSVFSEDGSLNRRALGDLVFSDPAAKRALEGVIHPLVQRIAMDKIEESGKNGARVAVLNVPLLFETGMDVLCDETWTLTAPADVQLARVMERDGLTREQAISRIESQMAMEDRNARATRVINSDRPIEKTRSELNQLYQQLIRRI